MLKQLCLGLISIIIASNVMAIEIPEYTVIEQNDKFELRHYQPQLIAETVVSGSLDEASSAGFKIIADYIFGNNTAQGGEAEKISMTAPVTMEAQSENIDMTAPVSIEQDQGKWRMHFVMPSSYRLDSLPTPNNNAVTIREIPAKNKAVIRFSGFAGEQKTAKKTAELLTWLSEKNITPIGTPQLARYNPPWTLPFFRRNEVMVDY